MCLSNAKRQLSPKLNSIVYHFVCIIVTLSPCENRLRLRHGMLRLVVDFSRFDYDEDDDIFICVFLSRESDGDVMHRTNLDSLPLFLSFIVKFCTWLF